MSLSIGPLSVSNNSRDSRNKGNKLDASLIFCWSQRSKNLMQEHQEPKPNQRRESSDRLPSISELLNQTQPNGLEPQLTETLRHEKYSTIGVASSYLLRDHLSPTVLQDVKPAFSKPKNSLPKLIPKRTRFALHKITEPKYYRTIPRSREKNNFICPEKGCHKNFPCKSRLQRHIVIHSGEKPFPCLYEGCSKRFGRRDNMMQHYRIHLVSIKKAENDKDQIVITYNNPDGTSKS